MRGRGRSAAILLAIWWVGFNLRAVLLAVPPVLATVRGDLHLSYTGAGLLTAVPVLAFAVAAVPGAGLVARLGAHRVVTLGLVALTAGTALRAVPGTGSLAAVFGGTAVLAVGIAIAQPGVPVVLQRWFPGGVQRASITVTLGLTMGELVGATVTRPWLVPMTGGGWRGSFLVWALPAALALVGWVAVVPARGPAQAPGRQRLGPLLHLRVVWVVAALFAAQSLVYFSANTWIPETAPGGPGGSAAALGLAGINGIQIPCLLLLTLIRRPFVTRRRFYLLGGGLVLVGTAGWLFASASPALLWSALIGAGVSMNFAALLAYPPTVAPPAAIAPFTAVMLAVGYGTAFLGPIAGGACLDLTHLRWTPFLPILGAAVAMVLLSTRLPASPWPVLAGRAPGPPVGPGLAAP
ncbi:MAG TPA: MFS transporter [Candidatus Dormibacteraeota bacterium]|nr:MFS transporter [Candidatus Dormibacteraeota bacterium]